MTDSQQVFAQKIILAPDLPQCRYDEVANRISMPATHLLWFLVEAAEDGRVNPDRLRTRIRKSGHDWTEEQLLSYLQELAATRCIQNWVKVNKKGKTNLKG